MKKSQTIGIVSVLCLMPFATVALGEVADQQETSAKIDPQATEVLKRAANYLRQLKSFTVDATIVVKMVAADKKHEFRLQHTVSVRRPNMFAMTLKSGKWGNTIVSDGEQVYTYTPLMNYYTVKEAPERLEDLAATLRGEYNWGTEGPLFVG